MNGQLSKEEIQINTWCSESQPPGECILDLLWDAISPIRMIFTKETNANKCWWELGKGTILFIVGGDLNLCSNQTNQYGGSWKKNTCKLNNHMTQLYYPWVYSNKTPSQEATERCLHIHTHSYSTGSKNITEDEVEKSQSTRKSTEWHEQTWNNDNINRHRKGENIMGSQPYTRTKGN